MSDYTPDMAGSGQHGNCVHCGKGSTPEGYDGCLGTLPEGVVMNACCGHGRDSAAYIQYRDGTSVRGADAITEQRRMKAERVSEEQDLARRAARLERQVIALCGLILAALLDPGRPGAREKARQSAEAAVRSMNELLAEERSLPAPAAARVREIKGELDRMAAKLEAWS